MGKVSWEKIKPCKNGGKIYLGLLPKRGSKCIAWSKSIGYKIPFLYGEFEGELIIKDYFMKVVSGKNKPQIVVDVVGWYEINFRIDVSSVPNCVLRELLHNVYANPNYPHRQLIIDSIGEEEAKKYTKSEHKKIEVICPLCGTKHSIMIYQLTDVGFSCPRCSDGVSYAEKLMMNILNYLGVRYTTQLPCQDGSKRSYDFYLPQYNAILETHGEQHYKDTGFSNKGGRTLEEEQANDVYKRKVALSNGIKDENYHEIDCRRSIVEWCRPNIEKALSKYVDMSVLTDEDWKYFHEQSQKNLVKQVCDYWNKNGGSGSELADIFGVSWATICTYLNKGTEFGWCKYDGSENFKNMYGKPCVAIKNGVVVFKARSCQELSVLLGSKSRGHVNARCLYNHNKEEYMKNHERKAYKVKGYDCMFYEDYLKLNENSDSNVA